MTRIEQRSLPSVIGVALLGFLAVPAGAQLVEIDELRPLQPNATVEIEVVVHSVVIEGWDRNEIQVVGEYDSDFGEMKIEGNERVFHFEIDHDGGRRGRREGSERLEVRVPRGVRLSLETVSGSLTVRGVNATLTASTVSGGIDVAGNIADHVSLSAVSGSISYTGDASTVSLESVSGRGEYVGTAGEVRLEAVSGALRMEGSAETIEAESVSGQVRIRADKPVQFLDASSVSGQVQFSGTLARGGRIDAESHSGTVELALGSDTDAEFELESFSGSVSASLPGMRDEIRSRSRFTPEQSLSFITGSGAGRVRASSFSGTVRIVESG